MVVHCSAGVGRTGTIISVIQLLEILEEQGKTKQMKDSMVSIFGMIRRLREQRTMMVQSEVGGSSSVRNSIGS